MAKETKFKQLAIKLRAFAKWQSPGYYATDADYAKSSALQEMAEALAEMLEEIEN